jgi:hypothetical protein
VSPTTTTYEKSKEERFYLSARDGHDGDLIFETLFLEEARP